MHVNSPDAWENMSLEALAGQIASENGMELYYSGPEHRFERQDQRNEGDIAFLNRLCGERSMYCKAHQGKIVLFDCDEAESGEAVFTVYKTGDMYSPKSYSFRVSSSNTDYTDAEVAYCDPRTGTTHKAKVKNAKKRDNDRPAKTLTVQKRVENPEQAAVLGKSELHAANVKEQTSSLEIMGCPGIASGQMLKLEDFGEFSGDYFVASATHKVSGSGLYSTSLELTTPAPTEAESAHEEKSEAAEAAKEEAAFAPYAETNARLDEQARAGFEEFLKSLPDHIAAPYELILCLPNILEEESKRAVKDKDEEKAKGLSILKQGVIRWLGFKGIKVAENNPNVLWVDWKWLLSEPEAKKAFEDIKANLFNEAAKEALAKNLDKLGYFTDSKRSFTFIEAIPHSWKDHHHQSRAVESSNWDRLWMKNGHVALLGDYQFYGLANGTVTPLGTTTSGKRKYNITIARAAIVMIDSFDFEEIQPLGVWDCEERKYMGWDIDPTKANSLWNQHFDSLREDYGNGADFYVAAPPKDVEVYKDLTYDVTI